MTDSSKVLLLLQLGTTLPMTGLIWFVQVCHYPLFASVGVDRFAAYENQHRIRTTNVVGPLMLVELAACLLFVGNTTTSLPGWMPLAGLTLIAIIWASTVFWQVPLHKRLSSGFDESVGRKLVRSNWLRTIAWTLRSALLLTIVWQLLP